MNQLLAILLIFAILSSFSNSASLQISLTCQTCTVDCPYSHCFKIQATGYDQQICGYQECDPSMRATFTATECSKSICYSGVCLSNGTTSICDQITTDCSVPTWYKFSCGDCSADLGCDKCTIISSSSFSGEQKSCNSSCIGNINYNTTFLPCPSIPEQSESTCPCCMQTEGFQSLIGKCSAINGYFNSSAFDKFFLNQSKKINEQGYFLTKLLMLFALFMMISL